MNRIIFLAALAVVASGCTQLEAQSEDSRLLGEVSDNRITDEDPGTITLNAKNAENDTYTYIVEVYPVGDYSEIADIYNRQGNRRTAFRLGEAVPGATTGQRFAEVRKALNVSSTVKVKAELYTVENSTVIDTETYKLRAIED